jgi:type I restriction enzyme R subunit
VEQAVSDQQLYRYFMKDPAIQEVNASPIDTFFEMVSEPDEYQKADIKKKFARYDHRIQPNKRCG